MVVHKRFYAGGAGVTRGVYWNIDTWKKVIVDDYAILPGGPGRKYFKAKFWELMIIIPSIIIAIIPVFITFCLILLIALPLALLCEFVKETYKRLLS